jgi:PEP-CTERM motif
MKLKRLAAAIVISLAATVAQAGTFDPDGTGPAPAINLGAFDWGPTSFLALGGNTAIAAFVGSGGACLAGSCNFSVLTQARLTATFNPGGTPNTPAGLNTTYEITMVGRFTETVTGVIGGGGPGTIAGFSGVPNTGFLQIYFDNALNANDLTGFGFSDGRLILNGQLANTPTGNFQIAAKDPIQCPTAGDCPLDLHGANDYAGQLTATGTGSNTNLTFSVSGQDSTFFINPLTALGLQIANVSIGLPFISVDPADCFNANAAFGGAIGTTNASVCNNVHVNGLLNPATQPGPGVIPSVGVSNGVLSAGGADFVAQTDFNSPLAFAVPEPGSVALLGISLFGMAVGLRRKWSGKA